MIRVLFKLVSYVYHQSHSKFYVKSSNKHLLIKALICTNTKFHVKILLSGDPEGQQILLKFFG